MRNLCKLVYTLHYVVTVSPGVAKGKGDVAEEIGRGTAVRKASAIALLHIKRFGGGGNEVNRKVG